MAGLMRDAADRGSIRASAGDQKPETEADFRRSLPENPGSPDVSQLPGGTRSATTAPSTPQTARNELHRGDDLGYTRVRAPGHDGGGRPDPVHRHGERPVPELQQDHRAGRRSAERRPRRLLQLGEERLTSDPRVRYDRLSGRWFITMIDVNGTNNRILLAVSSGSTVTNASNFTFFDIPSDSTVADAFHLRLRRLRHAGDRRERPVHRHQRVLRDGRLQGDGRVRRPQELGAREPARSS